MAAIISKPEGLEWLFDSSKVFSKDSKQRRFTMLAELGRFRDDEVIRAMAAKLCKEKPTTKDAIAYLRRVRLGKGRAHSVADLGKVIAKAIDSYVHQREVEAADILEALTLVYRVISRRHDNKDTLKKG